MQMMRWDIINALIKANNYNSYLEIGYYKGWSFDNVDCQNKTAVDPNPCKTTEQENTPEGQTIFEKNNCTIVKTTSDKYFHWLDSLPDDIVSGWDIIFIDGLHEAEQVYRDIQNSLRYLNEGGTIVIHDCNPPRYEHTTTGIDGCWTGDTYKGVIKSLFYLPVQLRTVDTDWGVGIMTVVGSKYMEVSEPEPDYETFAAYRDEYLNLITPEQFKEFYIKPKQNA